ncbi:hypothetical protein SMD44_08531 [Streptomyces alboflavus]|uniref:Uncharacterized protein n=1 Tax=Streptomyces alboflavus TaxID=67267 RepID=A0A1Z1WRL6_9ACTN|nr:hypothetical protein SMD44_08531 [Streptomyces alboflavus]
MTPLPSRIGTSVAVSASGASTLSKTSTQPEVPSRSAQTRSSSRRVLLRAWSMGVSSAPRPRARAISAVSRAAPSGTRSHQVGRPRARARAQASRAMAVLPQPPSPYRTWKQPSGAVVSRASCRTVASRPRTRRGRSPQGGTREPVSGPPGAGGSGGGSARRASRTVQHTTVATRKQSTSQFHELVRTLTAAPARTWAPTTADIARRPFRRRTSPDPAMSRPRSGRTTPPDHASPTPLPRPALGPTRP